MIDSNVVISAFLFGGPPAEVLRHVVEGIVLCFISIPIIEEIRDVLQRPKFGLSLDRSLAIVEELHAICSVVNPTRNIRAIAKDPDDNRVLECACAADVSIIVSGDAHLLDLGTWQNIRILSPSRFLKMLKPG